ncbi:hypothetical protein Hanom_Chr01g00081491 [Helianthus anomalus]
MPLYVETPTSVREGFQQHHRSLSSSPAIKNHPQPHHHLQPIRYQISPPKPLPSSSSSFNLFLTSSQNAVLIYLNLIKWEINIKTINYYC